MTDAQDQTMPQEGGTPMPQTPAESKPAHTGQQALLPNEGGAGRQTAQKPAGASAPKREFKPREENTIFIGRKSTMGYVLAVVTQFQHGSPHVKVKARGKLISVAVDVAEIARRRFLPDVKVGPISIQTEDLENEDGSRSKVSSIEIMLVK